MQNSAPIKRQNAAVQLRLGPVFELLGELASHAT